MSNKEVMERSFTDYYFTIWCSYLFFVTLCIFSVFVIASSNGNRLVLVKIDVMLNMNPNACSALMSIMTRIRSFGTR